MLYCTRLSVPKCNNSTDGGLKNKKPYYRKAKGLFFFFFIFFFLLALPAQFQPDTTHPPPQIPPPNSNPQVQPMQENPSRSKHLRHCAVLPSAHDFKPHKPPHPPVYPTAIAQRCDSTTKRATHYEWPEPRILSLPCVEAHEWYPMISDHFYDVKLLLNPFFFLHRYPLPMYDIQYASSSLRSVPPIRLQFF